jgi:predicted Na+-dependent transporter
VLGLLVSQSVLAIVLVPVSFELMNWALGVQAHFSAGQVAQLVVKAILFPLGAGMLALRFLPKLKHLAPHLLTAGPVLLIAGALPLYWSPGGPMARWPAIGRC